MSWHEVQLGNGIHVKHGFAFKGEHFSSSGEYLVLTPGNFLEKGGFRVRDGKERFYQADFPEDYLLSQDDLIVAMTEQGEGLLGSAARIPAEGKYLHNQRLGLVQITDPKLLDKKFLYWVFNSADVRAQIRATATGAKVKHTAPERIKKVRLKVPDLGEQKAIAWLLDSYDDLIATNQRRIALLEDAARRLYREWFVHLRFPGHESVPMKDGVPEGWRVSRFGDEVSIRKGKNLTKSSVMPGNVPVVAAGLEPMCYHNAANAEGPVITISASGANAGHVKLYHESIWASDCSYISNDVTDCLYFFYCALKERQTEILMMQKGAAQPHVYPKDIQAMEITWPCSKIVVLFQDYANSLYSLAGSLLRQNFQLAHARDLLLPKLMSGQFDVSGIRVPDEVAP